MAKPRATFSPPLLRACVGSAPSSDDDGAASGSESDSEEPSGRQQDQTTVVRDAAVSDLDYLRSRMRANFDLDDGAGQAAGAPGSDLAGRSGGEGGSDLGSERESEGAGEEGGNGSGEGSLGRRAATTLGPAGQDRSQQQQRQQQQQRARLRTGQPGAADVAEDEIDAVFGRATGRRSGASSSSRGEIVDSGSSELEEPDPDDDSGVDSSDDEEAAAPMEEDPPSEEDGQQAGGADAAADADAAHQAQRARGAALEVEAGGEASIGETGRLFVRNLPYSATEADLRELFERFGEVAEAHLVLDK